MKKNKIKWISRALTLYTFFSRHLKKNKTLNAEKEFQRIAIYSTTALGDLMFNTPAIDALKRRYPRASFVLVSSEKNYTLVAGSPWFDDVFYWDNKIRNAHRLIKSLRRFKPQLTVILHSHMPYDIFCAVVSNSEYIIRDNYRIDSPLMNSWLNAYSKSEGQHLIQRKLDLLGILGCDTHNPLMHIPVSYIASNQSNAIIRVGFQMGASEAKRCWPVARFAELAAQLCSEGGYQVVLIGGPKDQHLVDEFNQSLADEWLSHTENQVGKTSLTGLLTVIDGLDVLVTGDTGPLHLAIALQTPTVSLYADAEPKYTGPYQDKSHHSVLKIANKLSGSRQPLEQINAETVKQEVVRLTTQ
ncbi:glycosyltransferase family 9 protein [Erwinia sp. MYb416]|uniref:glycosyltransferase family 9 protein n=1 Tax=Erwinia sp. MYb416 TaxID=3108532 RepID=UPI0030983E79